MLEKTHSNDVITLTLRPNRSASWYQSKLLLLVIMLPLLTIGIGWSIVGAWPVLPVAGVEFLVLSYLTYLVSYQSYQEDTIVIDDQQIAIKNTIGKKKKRQSEIILKRSETSLYVEKPKRPLDLQVLYLEDTRNKIEVGHHLNEDDREGLRLALIEAGIILNRIPKTQA